MIEIIKDRKKIFINKARLVHNNAFSYKNAVYVNNQTKLIITCKKHGDFLHVPQEHLRGRNGCLECNGRNISTTEDFIVEANKIHKNNYDYDKVVYVNKVQKVIITCKKHGDFEQIASNHLKGHGCMECSGKTQKHTKRFITEANIKHNFRYNYDKAIYTKALAKVIITCKKHGDFEQAAYSHLYGIGCLECSGKTLKDTQRFITEANIKHNFRYNYDKVNYTKIHAKIIITCNIHGDFTQIPSDHLQGRGCNECGGTKLITYQKFIEDANKKHNNIYNYDKTLYKNSSLKVIINCKIHGDFKQIAYDHLNGCGCPKCKSSTGEKIIIEVLNKMNAKFIHQYKFDDCIHKIKLLYDFAVFIDDKVKLIEFHGRQHYEYVSFFHKKMGVKNQY